MSRAILAGLILALAADPSFAGNADRFYVGAAFGQGHYDPGRSEELILFPINPVPGPVPATANRDDNSVKITAGMQPWKHLAFEIGYADLGEYRSTDSNTSVTADVSAANALVVGLLPVSWVELYATIGVSYWESDEEHAFALVCIAGPCPHAQINLNRNDTAFMYGAGAQKRIGRLKLRAAYESFEVVNNVRTYSLGVLWDF